MVARVDPTTCEGEMLEVIAGNLRTLWAYTPELYPANLFLLSVLVIKKK